MLKTWMSAGFVKVCDNTEAPEITSNIVKLNMAKNESESALITINSDVALNDVYFTVHGVTEDLNVTIFKEYTIKTGDDYYPDPIVPVEGKFSIEPNKNVNFRVRVTTTEKSRALQYSLTVRLQKGEDIMEDTIMNYNFDVKVWKFASPDKPTC